MVKISPLARRITQCDAGHQTSDATTSKGEMLITEGRFLLEARRRCGHLVVLDTTAMTAPNLATSKNGQMQDNSVFRV